MRWIKAHGLAAIGLLCVVGYAGAGDINIGDGVISISPDGIKVGPVEVGRDKEPGEPGDEAPETKGQYTGQSLQHSDLSNSDLNGQDFSNSNLVSVDFSNSNLNGANFAGANLVGVDLSNTDLNGANFKGAKLQGVDLSNSNLQKACLINTKLVGVDFSNSDLSYAILAGHKNLGSDFSNAKTDGTVWKGDRTCPGGHASNNVPQQPAAGDSRPELTTAATIQKALSTGPDAKVDLTVNFEVDSDKILGEARAQVLEIAKALKSEQLQSNSILIEGHTDSTGGDDYNMDLSYRRAISVMRALSEEYQVNGDRLKVRGHGETQPVASNDTDDGRTLNRRVTLVNTGS